MSVPGGKANQIGEEADIADGMSEVGGTPKRGNPPPTATIKAFSSGATDLCARDPIRDIQIMCLGSGVEPKATSSRIGHLSVS